MPNSSFFSVIYKIPAGLSGKEDITFTASFDFSSGQCFLFQQYCDQRCCANSCTLAKVYPRPVRTPR